jgi:hypothetical protein
MQSLGALFRIVLKLTTRIALASSGMQADIVTFHTQVIHIRLTQYVHTNREVSLEGRPPVPAMRSTEVSSRTVGSTHFTRFVPSDLLGVCSLTTHTLARLVLSAVHVDKCK